MTIAGAFVVFGLLGVAAALPWIVRWATPAGRAEELPPAAQARAGAVASLALAVLLLLLARLSAGRLVTLGHLWRADPWSALLLGALAGLFLHFAGSGSPLPIASLRQRRGDGPVSWDALLFVLGAAGTVAIWFGAGLPSLLRWLPRLPSLLLAGAGYGLARGGAGQDHVILGAVDGLLLGLLGLLTGSVVAVLLAQVVADVWAYAGAAAQAEDLALALDAGEPNLPDRQAGPPEVDQDRVERLG